MSNLSGGGGGFMKFKFCFILIMFVLSLWGCALPRNINFDKRLFDENYNKWKSLNISNYTFTYRSFGFSGCRADIVIKNNNVYDCSRDGYDGYEDNCKNIDGYFDGILSFYNEYNGKSYTDQEMFYTDIVVKYDKEYGFPESWYYDYYCPYNLAVDGNFDFKISNFDLTGD